ncbi:ThuA domain-containing protein [uncultured Draconibacterium sp.]|uniref:ThuA domain-containing protein n=1 Tax=uncultured Draconibacterium sp. TaxID=1573823 RepID=UPI0032170C0B
MKPKNYFILFLFVLPALTGFAQETDQYPANYASAPRFKALLYYTTRAEKAHVDFAEQTVRFFQRLSWGEGYILDTCSDFSSYTFEKLKEYDILIMPNAMPSRTGERKAFEQYMENGGGWLGFHASAYNDKSTNWSWLVSFLGGGVFYCNNWPPQPVLVQLDNNTHATTKNLPAEFVVPASEWYQWNPSPRKNSDVEVLLSISPRNYPLGIKDVVSSGDWPIVWTNKKYRMIYLNMGHGDEEYTDAAQNLLFINAFRWVLTQSPKGDPFKK